MVRRKEAVVALDTHIVMWLYDGLVERLSDAAKQAIRENEVRISWMVALELQYLNEIGRFKASPRATIRSLSRSISLKMSESDLESLIKEAFRINWTRDVFDRMIVADAVAGGYGLVTKDQDIRKNTSVALW